MFRVPCLLLATALLAVAIPAGAKSPPLPRSAEVLHFTGTEPFWAGTVRRTRMVYSSPDNGKGEVIRVRRQDAPHRIRFRGRMARDGMFTMIVLARPCSDGMSDNAYPYDVTIDFGSNRLLGCGWTARHPYKPGE